MNIMVIYFLKFHSPPEEFCHTSVHHLYRSKSFNLINFPFNHMKIEVKKVEYTECSIIDDNK